MVIKNTLAERFPSLPKEYLDKQMLSNTEFEFILRHYVIDKEVVNMEKIGFKNLNGWLKTLVILGWIYTAIFGISFLVGFIQELLLY